MLTLRPLARLLNLHAPLPSVDPERPASDIEAAYAPGLSEDDQKIWEGEMQEITNRFIKAVDDQLETKQAEIMQV